MTVNPSFPADAAGRGEEGRQPLWLPLLPAAWRRPGGLPPREEVWGYLREWSARVRSRLDELEGYLLAAESEAALAPLAPGTALADLKRVRPWVEALGRAPRLEVFEEELRLRPGMWPVYERLERWRTFLGGPDHPRVILAHRYLTDPDLALPPEEPFKELRELRDALLDMLADSSVVLDDEGRRRFWDGLAAFRLRFRALYVREHDRRRKPEALAPYRRLRDGAAFRLLQRLRALEGAPVRAGLARLEARLQSLLATQCPGVNEEALEARPVCTCGFRLDSPPPGPPEAIAAEITREIWHGIRILTDPEVRRRLDAYLASRNGVPPESGAARLARLLAWLDARADADGESAEGDPDDVDALSALLDDGVIGALNEGLRHGAVFVVPRSLEALIDRLAGRDWSPEQLQDAVMAWAFGGEAPVPGMAVRPVWGGGSERAGGPDVRGRTRPKASRGESARSSPFPRTFHGWEELYRREGAAGLGLAGNEAFQRFYREAVRAEGTGGGDGVVALSLFEPPLTDGLLAGMRRPVTLPLLLERVVALRRTEPGTWGLVWVDALRWDVWQQFLQRFGADLHVEETGFLWALPPTTTAGQMGRVDAHGIRFSLCRPPESPPGPEGARRLPSFPGNPATGGDEPYTGPIVYVRSLEEALSQSAPLEDLPDTLARELLPLLAGGFPKEWLVFSDHGFAEQRGPAGRGRAGGEGRTYRQGGDTTEEVLVPWARVRWVGAGAKTEIHTR